MILYSLLSKFVMKYYQKLLFNKLFLLLFPFIFLSLFPCYRFCFCFPLLQKELSKGCERAVGLALYTCVTAKWHPGAIQHRDLLIDYILKKKVTSLNLDASIKYLNKLVGQEVDVAKFESECGVGVVFTKEQIDQAVAEHLAKEKDLKTIRYQYNIAGAMATIKNALKWADAKLIKESLDEQILKLLGPKTEEDAKAAAAAKKKPAKEAKV